MVRLRVRCDSGGRGECAGINVRCWLVLALAQLAKLRSQRDSCITFLCVSICVLRFGHCHDKLWNQLLPPQPQISRIPLYFRGPRARPFHVSLLFTSSVFW